MANDTKKAALIICGIAIGVFILFALKNVNMGNRDRAESLGKAVAGVQEITLTLDRTTLNYRPDPITVKAGVPVRITVDTDSVRGCTSAIVMPAFGIQKRAVPGDNVIEFTPEKPGTYQFSCAMGMSQGTIVVV